MPQLPRRPASAAEMRVAALVELVIGIAHRLGPSLAEHDLEIHRFEALVLEAVDDPGRAGDAFPWPQALPHLPAGLVLDEDGQDALQHKKDLLDLMRMRGVALARRAIDDAQREGARRDNARVIVLPRAAGADKAVLGAAVAVDLRVLEGLPIRRLVAEPADIALGDLVERERGDLGRHLVAGGSHHGSPSANGLHVISVGPRPCRARPWRAPRPCPRP